MRTTYFISLIFLLSVPLLSQNEIQNYQPPKVINGSNLTLSFQSDFQTRQNALSEKDTHAYLHFSGDYRRWKLTNKINYAIGLNTGLGFEENKTSDPIYPDGNIDRKNYFANLYLSGGITCYFLKGKLYGGIFEDANVNFNSRYKPDGSARLFPSLGTGRIVNAAQVTDADNMEKALLENKIISNSIPLDVKKKLIEFLDRRNSGEFLSEYKDDNDIEFYSAIENLFLNSGVIKAPLGSRAVLKLFQVLTNHNFVYFPKYKGWMAQAELMYTTSNSSRDSTAKSYVNSVTLSGVYGLPLNNNLSLLGSVFAAFPVAYDHLGNYTNFSFHAPIFIAESNLLANNSSRKNLVPQEIYIYSFDKYKYKVSAMVEAFYNINNTAGVDLNMQYGLAKIIGDNTKSSFVANLSFIFNVLSKMGITASAYFTKSYSTKYNFSGGLGASYFIW